MSILVGSCDDALVPDCVRAVGVRVWPDGARVTVLVPAATAATLCANLERNPRLAITTAGLPTFATLQLKGRVVARRQGDERDRALALDFQPRFAEEFAWAGPLTTATRRIAVWPCLALDVAVEAVHRAAPDPLGPDRGAPGAA